MSETATLVAATLVAAPLGAHLPLAAARGRQTVVRARVPRAVRHLGQRGRFEAAAGIHTDLAKGFIRAETMSVPDLVRLGSEREIKAAGLMRQEPKDYVIQDGDIITIKHN